VLNELETTNVITSISQPRFHTYMKAFSQIVPSETTSSEYRKVLFYFHIQNIYSCFYVPIQTLEITIRNQVHTQMSLFYSSEYWFNYLTSEAFCTKISQDIISAAKKKTSSDFRKKTVASQPVDVLCRMTFGIWPEILNAPYRSSLFWQKHASDVFPNKGKVKLGKIYDNLLQIGTLRNRLYHYEPLWKASHNFKDIDDFCSKIESQFNIIMNLIKFCSVEKYKILANHRHNLKIKILEFRNSFHH